MKTFPIVCGQPRSGTSMLMRILTMGGVDTEYKTGESEDTKKLFRNIYGMFETDTPSYTKCFKCTNYTFVRNFPENAKIIYITRNVEQQAKSWKAVRPQTEHLERCKKNRELFQNALKDKEVLHLTYEDIILNPIKECGKIKEYLGEFDVENAAKAVDKTLFIKR